ncbi:YncE family protein (plasmid) [Escherichia coli]
MNPMDHIQLSDIQRIYPATTVVELVFSDAQQALFVSAPDWEDETQSRVLRINPQTLSVEAEIALPVKGFGVALDDKRGLLYLTQGFNGSVAVVDICKNRLIATIPLMEEVVFEQRYQQEGISGARLAFLMRELARFGVSEGYPWKLRELVFDPVTERLFLPGLGLGIDSVLFVIDTRERRLEKVLPGFRYNVVGITLDRQGGECLCRICRDSFLLSIRTR